MLEIKLWDLGGKADLCKRVDVVQVFKVGEIGKTFGE